MYRNAQQKLEYKGGGNAQLKLRKAGRRNAKAYQRTWAQGTRRNLRNARPSLQPSFPLSNQHQSLLPPTLIPYQINFSNLVPFPDLRYSSNNLVFLRESYLFFLCATYIRLFSSFIQFTLFYFHIYSVSQFLFILPVLNLLFSLR